MNSKEAEKYFKGGKSYEVVDSTDLYNKSDVNPVETQTPAPKYDPSRIALARTSWGEGRNQGIDGMHLIQNVINNRANSGGTYNWPDNVFDVTRQRKQFSAWNEGDPNKAKMEALDPNSENQQFRDAYEISDKPLPQELQKIFGDADHYHTDKVSPDWSKSPKMRKLGQHGSHIFYTTKPGTGVTPAANMTGGTL